MAKHAPQSVRLDKARTDNTNQARAINIAEDSEIQELLNSAKSETRAPSLVERDVLNAEAQIRKQEARIESLTLELSNSQQTHPNKALAEELTQQRYGVKEDYSENVLDHYDSTGARFIN